MFSTLLDKVQGSAEDEGSCSRSYDDDDAESRAETFFSCGSDLEEEEVTTTDTPYFEECGQGKRIAVSML